MRSLPSSSRGVRLIAGMRRVLRVQSHGQLRVVAVLVAFKAPWDTLDLHPHKDLVADVEAIESDT